MCPINDGVEDTEHFLLLCDSYKEHRCNLLADVNAVLQNSGHSVWSNSFLQLLLYGDQSLSYEANRSILTLTNKSTIVFVGFYCVEMIFCFSSLSLVSSTHECLLHSLLHAPI